MPASDSHHAREKERSYRNLDAARREAALKSHYDSASTRSQLTSLFQDRFGSPPHPWQLDVTEALLLGLDSVVIAGTGSGKTIPFMLPLLLDNSKKIVVISPLKVLQEDQASRFKKLGLSAIAVNGDTWDQTMHKDLKAGRHQGVLTSPEMCLKHPEFRQVLTSHFQDICTVVVDEAHCIAQWGGDFRTAYAELGKLRAFFPPHISILATSATLPPFALEEVHLQLGIDAATSFHLNLGNDRPNISFATHTINSSDDFESLRPFLSRTNNPRTANDLVKSIVFVNSLSLAQNGTRAIRKMFPEHLHRHIDYLYSLRSPQAKREIMRKFRRGEGDVRILIATEAAGMGADIPDIEQVIQFGVPSSLSVWMQRAGRAGRSPSLNARALLLVEKSMFRQQKKKKRHKNAGLPVHIINESYNDNADTSDSGNEDTDVGDDNDTPDNSDMHEATAKICLEDGHEWKKKVEENLRQWIETKGCRRDVSDRYFDNPSPRKAPTDICCDNCSLREIARPVTPQRRADSSSARTTPTTSPNLNGKRTLTFRHDTSDEEEITATQIPKSRPPRRGEHLKQARSSLERWRSRSRPPAFTLVGFMPDSVIKSLASAAHISTVDELKSSIPWAYAGKYGEDVLEVLRKIDKWNSDLKQAAKDAKAAERHACQLIRDQEADRVREERNRQREAGRQAREIEAKRREEEKAFDKEVRRSAAAAKKAEREAMKLAARLAKKQKTTPQGSSFEVLSLTPCPNNKENFNSSTLQGSLSNTTSHYNLVSNSCGPCHKVKS